MLVALFLNFDFVLILEISKMNNDTNHNSNTGGSNNGLKIREIIKHNGKTMDSVESDSAKNFKAKIRWPDLMAQLFLHIGAVYGLIFQFYTIRFYTLIWCK